MLTALAHSGEQPATPFAAARFGSVPLNEPPTTSAPDVVAASPVSGPSEFVEDPAGLS